MRKKSFAKQPITRREYYRLIAEVRALGSFIREMWIALKLFEHERFASEKESPSDKANRSEFEKLFDHAIELKYARLLEAIEEKYPELAAELDDRKLEEIDPEPWT